MPELSPEQSGAKVVLNKYVKMAGTAQQPLSDEQILSGIPELTTYFGTDPSKGIAALREFDRQLNSVPDDQVSSLTNSFITSYGKDFVPKNEPVVTQTQASSQPTGQTTAPANTTTAPNPGKQIINSYVKKAGVSPQPISDDEIKADLISNGIVAGHDEIISSLRTFDEQLQTVPEDQVSGLVSTYTNTLNETLKKKESTSGPQDQFPVTSGLTSENTQATSLLPSETENLQSPLAGSTSGLGGTASGLPVQSGDQITEAPPVWNQAPKGPYKAGLGDTSPVSRGEATDVAPIKKPISFPSVDELIGNITPTTKYTEVNDADTRNLVLNTDTGKPFGSLISKNELVETQRKSAEIAGDETLSQELEKKTTEFFNSAAEVNKENQKTAEENFKVKIATQSGIPVETVDANKEQWAFEHKVKFPNGEDGLSLEERQIRDKYANSYAVKKADEIKSEYFDQLSAQLGEKAPEYWKKKSQEMSMSFVSPEDLQVAALKQKITNLETLEKRTVEQEIELKKHKTTLQTLVDAKLTGTDLFDNDGKFLLNKKIEVENQEQFVDSVNKYAAIYDGTDKATLTKERDSAFFQYVYAKRQFDELASDPNNQLGKDMYGENLSQVNNPEVLAARKYMDDRLAYFMGVNRALLLNEDPGTGEQDSFLTGISEGFKESIGLQSFSESSSKDYAIQGIQNAGFEATPEQLEKAGSQFWETAGKAVGGSIIPMAEIGVNLFLTNKVAGALQIPKLAQLWAGTNKTKQLAANLTWDMISNGIAFSGAGESAFAGVGEGIGQGSATAFMDWLGKKNKLTRMLVRGIGGIGGEVTAEYTGQFADELFKENGNLQTATEATFGKTAEEGIEKLIITSIVAGLFTAPGVFMNGGNEKSFLFANSVMDQVKESDSDSPIVQYAKENDFTKPATKEEIAKKDEVIAKKEAGEEVTPEEIAQAELTEARVEFQKTKDIPVENATPFVSKEEGAETEYIFTEGEDGGFVSEKELIAKLDDKDFVQSVSEGKVLLDVKNPSPEVEAKIAEVFPENTEAAQPEIQPESQPDLKGGTPKPKKTNVVNGRELPMEVEHNWSSGKEVTATTPEEAVSFAEENKESIVNDYISNHEKGKKNIVDPDAIREYLAEAGYSGKNVPMFLKASHNLTDAVFAKMLENVKGKKLTILSGVGGAGKTHATRGVDGLGQIDTDMTFDSALNWFEDFKNVIDKAQKAGAIVEVVPVYNDLITTFKNTISRGKKEGRFLNINYFLNSFEANRSKLIQLKEAFPDVKTFPVDNSENNPKKVSTDESLLWDYGITEEGIVEILNLVANDKELTAEQIQSITDGIDGIRQRIEGRNEKVEGLIERIKARTEQVQRGDGTTKTEGTTGSTEQPVREVRLEKPKKTKVYHGGNLSDGFRSNEPLFVSENESQAAEYTKENKGTVNEFEIDSDKIASESDARSVISDLGLKSKDPDWNLDELNLYEILDSKFETSLSDSDIKKVYSELQKRGFEAVRFTDMNIDSLKNDIENIVVINPESLTKSEKTQKSDVKPKKIKEAAKSIADKIREAKFDTTGLDQLSTDLRVPFKAAFNLGVTTLAATIEAGGTIAQAVADGVAAIKQTDWYKSLSEDGKKTADKMLAEKLESGLTKEVKTEVASSLSKKQKRTREALRKEPLTARDQVLQFFIAGGKLTTDAIRSLMDSKGKGKKLSGEYLTKLSMTDNTKGVGVDELANMLWNSQDENGAQFEVDEFRDAVEQVMLDHSNTTTMVNEMLDEGVTEDQYNKEKFAEQQDEVDKLEKESKEAFDAEAEADKKAFIKAKEKADAQFEKEKAAQVKKEKKEKEAAEGNRQSKAALRHAKKLKGDEKQAILDKSKYKVFNQEEASNQIDELYETQLGWKGAIEYVSDPKNQVNEVLRDALKLDASVKMIEEGKRTGDKELQLQGENLFINMSLEGTKRGQANAYMNEVYKRNPSFFWRKKIYDAAGKAQEAALDQMVGEQTAREAIEEVRKELEAEMSGLKEQVAKLTAEVTEALKTKGTRRADIEAKIEQGKKAGAERVKLGSSKIKQALKGKGGTANAGIDPLLLEGIIDVITGYIQQGTLSTAKIVTRVYYMVKDSGGKISKDNIKNIAESLDEFASLKRKEQVKEFYNKVSAILNTKEEVTAATIDKMVENPQSLWEQYQGNIVAKIRAKINQLGEGETDVKQKAELEKLAAKITKEINAKISEISSGSGKRTGEKASAKDTMIDLMSNSDKIQALYTEILNGKDVPVETKNAITALMESEVVFSRGLVENLINEELQRDGKKMNDIITDHYTGKKQFAQTLSETLVREAGLSNVEAEYLAGEIESKMMGIIQEKAEKALTKMLAKTIDSKVIREAIESGNITPEIQKEIDKRLKTKENRKLINKVTRAINLGALQSPHFIQAFSDKFGFADIDVATSAKLDSLISEIARLRSPQETSKVVDGETVNTFQRERVYSLEKEMNTLIDTLSPRNFAWFAENYVAYSYMAILSGVSTTINSTVGIVNGVFTEGLAFSVRNIASLRGLLLGMQNGFGALKAASSRASLARKTHTIELGGSGYAQDSKSNVQGAAEAKLTDVEKTMLEGVSGAIKNLKGTDSNVKKALNLVASVYMQSFRLFSLLSASDAFISTVVSNMIATTKTYNKIAKELNLSPLETFTGVEKVKGSGMSDMSFIERVQEAMGNDQHSKDAFETIAKNEHAQMEANIKADLIAKGYSGAELEKRTERELRKKVGGVRYFQSAEKAYTSRRKQELKENKNMETLSYAVGMTKDALMIGEPDGVMGLVSKGISSKTAIRREDSALAAAIKAVLASVLRFPRLGANSLNKIKTATPFLGAIDAFVGFGRDPKTGEFQTGSVKDFFTSKYRVDPERAWQRLAMNTLMTTATFLIFRSMYEWDDEEKDLKLRKDRMFDVFGPGGWSMKDNLRKYEDFKKLSFSFQKDVDGQFTNYFRTNLSPQLQVLVSFLGAFSDDERGLGGSTDITERKGDPSSKFFKGAINNTFQAWLDGSFNSIGRYTATTQYEDNGWDAFLAVLGQVGTDIAKPTIQPSMIRDVTSYVYKSSGGNQKKIESFTDKFIQGLYGADFELKDKTDMFGNTYPVTDAYDKWIGGVEKMSEKHPEVALVYKFEGGLEVTKWQATNLEKYGTFSIFGVKYESQSDEVKDMVVAKEEELFKKYVTDDYEYLNSIDDKSDLEREMKFLQNMAKEEAKLELIEQLEKDGLVKQVSE